MPGTGFRHKLIYPGRFPVVIPPQLIDLIKDYVKENPPEREGKKKPENGDL